VLERDPVVAAHYAGFRTSRARLDRLEQPLVAYVSYRVHNAVYWTRHPVKLPQGETVLSDGEHLARARCGNRISLTPQQPVGPPVDLDKPEVPPAADAGAIADALPSVADLPLVVHNLFPAYFGGESPGGPVGAQAGTISLPVGLPGTVSPAGGGYPGGFGIAGPGSGAPMLFQGQPSGLPPVIPPDGLTSETPGGGPPPGLPFPTGPIFAWVPPPDIPPVGSRGGLDFPPGPTSGPPQSNPPSTPPNAPPLGPPPPQTTDTPPDLPPPSDTLPPDSPPPGPPEAPPSGPSGPSGPPGPSGPLGPSGPSGPPPGTDVPEPAAGILVGAALAAFAVRRVSAS